MVRVAEAVPACPRPTTVIQPDGRAIQIYLRGDEFLHWHEDSAGFTILKEEKTGRWVYAVRDDKGKLAPCGLVVGRHDPRSLGVVRHLLPVGAEEHSRAAREQLQQAAALQAGLQTIATTGTIKNLVVLVEFSNLKHTHPSGDFDDLFNEPGYSTDGALGSVKDYFHEVSYYGRLTFDSVVTDWVTLTNTYQYYGTNDYWGNDLRPQQMVEEALSILHSNGFNFALLDGDGDGWVDNLTVAHAGWGEEYKTNDVNYIWSHHGGLSKTVTYDGVKMRLYCTVPERRRAPPFAGITRIGVICHELGHTLGLPDLYDTSHGSIGVGEFCLMGFGNWNGDDGNAPAHTSAWCKQRLGWLEPVVASASTTYNISRVEDNPVVYRLNGLFPTNQYFLIENRQQFGFDLGLPGPNCGLLIWHVDEAQSNNTDHTHYMVDLEEASGTQHLELSPTNTNWGDDFDYYREGNATTFSVSSNPNNRSYASQWLGLDICGVSTSGTTMAFSLMPPVVVWDNNLYGQENVPPNLTTAVQVTGGSQYCMALKTDHKIVVWGNDIHGVTNVPPSLSNVVAIAGGVVNGLAVKSNGTVAVWGDDSHGQTDVPPELTNVVAVSGGAAHCLALKASGTVVSWGNGDYGLSNVPPGLATVVAVAAGGYHSLALKGDGTVVGWGDDGYNQATAPTGLTNVVAIAAGIWHSLALRGDGTVIGWGRGVEGQLNIPEGLSNVVAIAAGGFHSVVLKDDGTVLAWGGQGGTDVPSCLSGVVGIGAGSYHSLALKGNGAPVITVQPFDKTVGVGATLTYQVMALGDAPLYYQWKKDRADIPDGGSISGATTPTLTVAGVDHSDAGKYSVYIHNEVGTLTSASAVLTVMDSPVASFTATPTTNQFGYNGAAPLNVTFTDTSTGSPAKVYWDLGDATETNTAAGAGFTHTYLTGIYTVALTASNLVGTSTIIQTNLIRVITPFEDWQFDYFASTNSASAIASADPDGDGQNNTAEFLVGADPTNSASAFRITGITAVSNDVRITWTTGTGRTNALQRAGDLAGSFVDIFTVTNATVTVTNYLDVGGATNTPAYFYRVRLVP